MKRKKDTNVNRETVFFHIIPPKVFIYEKSSISSQRCQGLIRTRFRDLSNHLMGDPLKKR